MFKVNLFNSNALLNGDVGHRMFWHTVVVVTEMATIYRDLAEI